MTVARFLVIGAIAPFIVSGTCCPPAPFASITLTQTPACGSDENLKGRVDNLPNYWCYAVTVHIYVDGVWWGKPYEESLLTYLNPDYTFEVDITTGGATRNDESATKIQVSVVPTSYIPQLHQPPPPTEALTSVTIDRPCDGKCSAQGPDLSFLAGLTSGTEKWINYTPNHYEPDVSEPDEGQIRSNLQQLYEEGYRGVVTYTVTGTLGDIPRIAREVGFRVVGAGIWDVIGAEEIDKAVGLKDYVDFYSVGNEGIFAGGRYTRGQLAQALQTVRNRTCKAVTTSEPWYTWRDNPDLVGMVDFVAANIYGWWDGAHDPQAAVDLLVSYYGALAPILGNKTAIVRETGFPTADHPDAGIAKQRCYFQLLEATDVPFVYFEAYDQYWKHEPDGGHEVGTHWGLHDKDGNLKQNHSPVAAGQSVSTPSGTPVAVTLSATDPDGDQLTYAVVTSPSNGSLTGTAPNLTYASKADFTGQDAVTFSASDCELGSNVATVTITVTGNGNGGDGEPEVAFTSVPPRGSFENLRGITRNVDRTAFRVVVYIRVDGVWWVKPTFGAPLTPIQPDGTWTCDITTGGHDQDASEIRAYVVRSDYPAPGNALPAEGDSIASASVPR